MESAFYKSNCQVIKFWNLKTSQSGKKKEEGYYWRQFCETPV